MRNLKIVLALACALLSAAPAIAQTPNVTGNTFQTGQPGKSVQGVVGMCVDAVTSNAVPCGSGSTGAPNPIGITPTDRTVTSATGASQTVMAANATRHSLTIVNTGSANCGINPTGGTAVIGGAGTLTLTPGGAYTPRIPTLSAVTAICTLAQPLYADEN